MSSSKKTDVPLSSDLKNVLEDELSRLKITVEERARILATNRISLLLPDGGSAEEKSSPPPSVLMGDLSRALDETLGRKDVVVVPKTTFFDFFPPFSCLCFLMCLIFGGFGLFHNSDKNGGFLDIAKIFAGALVGSTTSTVVSATRSKRGAR